MAKKGKHPTWYDSKIFCEGKLVLIVGGTKKELNVDIWSGNHPYFTGSKKVLDSEGRVEKFEKKYRIIKHNANN